MLRQKYLILFLSLMLVFVFSGCGGEKQETQAPPPPQVTVDKPLVKTIDEYVYYTGNLMASEYVEIRSRVEGYLQSINFDDGSRVKKGDLLFVIDPKPYIAALNQAKADLKVMQAELQLAKAKLKRMDSAYKSKAVSELEVLEARANVDMYNANVTKAKEQIVSARLDLSYTSIKAPFSGKIGRNLVDVGNLVTPGSMTLTTIVKDDPMFAYVYMNERNLLYLLKNRELEGKEKDTHSVHMKLADSDNYSYEGSLDFMQNKLDPRTGTIELRGVFENKDHSMIPGLFTNMRIPVAKRENAILITERALGIDQKGHYLYVVNGQDEVEYRPVKIGPLMDGNRVIYEGIEADDRVIVKGILRARPGIKVSPMSPKEEQQMTERVKQEKAHE